MPSINDALCIVGGDLNSCFSIEDRIVINTGEFSGAPDAMSEVVNELLADFSYVDNKHYTRCPNIHTHDFNHSAAKLDHFFISLPLEAFATTIVTTRTHGNATDNSKPSDH
eukprot:12318159-Karenia_brevis.AAC.1